MKIDISQIRHDFPILGRTVYDRQLVYLDNAATTQKPLCVLDAMRDEYLNVNANVHRGVHYLSQQATDLHEAARERVRQFIGAAKTEEIVFTRGTTEAMQTANSSVRRLSLNIVERLEMSEEDLRTDFLDFCFEHMIDVGEFSGIQSVCMKLAFRMCKFYPELMGELKRTLEAMEIDYYKPAVKCVRNKILNGKLK